MILSVRQAAACLLVLLLTGCALPGPRDGAPPHPVDLSTIPDAVPRVEPLSTTGNPPSYVVFGQRYEVMASAAGHVERGLASWYGTKFHGRSTSSGEPYDMYAMTAAHKHLPLPTYAEVTNLKNGRKVVVKINDRGPFHPDRIIDLSYAAALKLDIVGHGVGLVEIRAIDPSAPEPVPPVAAPVQPTPPQITEPQIWIQVGAFGSEANAAQLKSQLDAARVARVRVVSSPQKSVYRVRIGPLADAETADELASALRQRGLATPQIVVE